MARRYHVFGLNENIEILLAPPDPIHRCGLFTIARDDDDNDNDNNTTTRWFMAY